MSPWISHTPPASPDDRRFSSRSTDGFRRRTDSLAVREHLCAAAAGLGRRWRPRKVWRSSGPRGPWQRAVGSGARSAGDSEQATPTKGRAPSRQVRRTIGAPNMDADRKSPSTTAREAASGKYEGIEVGVWDWNQVHRRERSEELRRLQLDHVDKKDAPLLSRAWRRASAEHGSG